MELQGKCRSIYKRPGQASLLGSIGEGDDATGSTDEDYLTWKELIMGELKNVLSLDEQEQKFKPSFQLEILDTIDSNTSLGEPTKNYLPSALLKGEINGPFSISEPYLGHISNSRELFKSDDRNCIHSEFDISNTNLTYSTGDHLGIWPSNANEKVEQFLVAFNLNPETIFNMRQLDPTIKVPFPLPTTIGAAVRYYMEITGPVSRQFFGHLIQFAPNNDIKEKLTILSNDKNKFQTEITSKFFNIADAILYLSGGIKWETVPWGFLIETIPHLLPRYYSISSSSSLDKDSIHVTSVVENSIEPKSNTNVVGVTTNLLRNIQLAENKMLGSESNPLPVHYDLNGPRDLFRDYKLPIHVRKSTFRLPTNPSAPVIMIGPGTGVAPFRGFVRDRVNLLESDRSIKLGKHLLFYGCRNEDDYLYREEWIQYATILGESFEMNVAFSRVPGTPKIYVQDKLREQSKLIWQLIQDGAFLYVCGDAGRMAKDVHKTLLDIVMKEKGVSEDDAIEVIKMLKTSNRYQEDIW